MRDKNGFVRLFNLNVPLYSEFDYYIGQLSKLYSHRDIYEWIRLYEEFEFLDIDIFKYKMSKSQEIISYIKNTDSYKRMLNDDILPIEVNNNVSFDEGKKYVSIDLSKANWQSIKFYDDFSKNEIGDSYQSFLKRFDLPDVFLHSKIFRQYIFGNLNMKKQINTQHRIIKNILEQLSNTTANLEFIRNDEIIYSYHEISQISEQLSLKNDKIHVNMFIVDKVENFYIKSNLDIGGKIMHKNLLGCPGNRFYINLKKYITGEKLVLNDLLFRIDGNTVCWYDEFNSIKN